MNRLRGKVAVVTGGASGIGRAIVEAFIEQGARVVIADLGHRAQDASAELGSTTLGVSADVSVSSDVHAMLQAAIDRFGQIDILCNNAGLDGEQTSIEDYDEMEFDRVVAVNLRGTFLGIKHVIPHLKERGGAIINTASIAGSVVMPNMPAYCAAKAGVMQLTKVAAVECAPYGIQVNTICPGVIRTAMLEALPADFIRGLEQATPMGRIADPGEVGRMAVFLASGESAFLTGCSINIDGGFTLL